MGKHDPPATEEERAKLIAYYEWVLETTLSEHLRRRAQTRIDRLRAIRLPERRIESVR